ncbi:MAG: carboxypeptidase-like regulatory domain-containing protein [Candidatus Thermoplasmatota archaeon]|nr:carboxypeptidase-like regulatory domain-containing protein [Candidatus Thermoplasmatota archaeon]MEC7255406.1 carboxypeptidase-like regulatory domain-containing protein [Candidatus Thermoplasmatota archaeon]MEC8313115.1 carboxypeptidase-like regulatory domain-containing protein [Candidatus Thermoplasmatota archaeon]
MSDKSFEERRAALRERVKDQLEGKEPAETNTSDDGRNSELENEIVVKPMIDLDYDDRERLRMVVAILILIGSILGIISGGILLQGNPDELLNSSLFNEVETVDLTGQILTVDGVTLQNASVELFEEDSIRVSQSTVSDENGYFQFNNVKPEVMKIMVVIDGYVSVERIFLAENGLVKPFTMEEGDSSTINQEPYVGNKGGWSLEAAVALSTFLGVLTIITGFVGIQASVEARRGNKYRRTQYLAGVGLFSRGLIWIGPILILAGMALNSLVKDQYEDYTED